MQVIKYLFTYWLKKESCRWVILCYRWSCEMEWSRPGGERWVCHCTYSISPWKPVTLRATVSSALSSVRLPLASNTVFCLNGVLKIVCSRRDIGLSRTSLLAWTKILCDSELCGKAYASESQQEKRWLLGEQLNCWHRDIRCDWKLFSSPAIWKRKQMSQREWRMILSAWKET